MFVLMLTACGGAPVSQKFAEDIHADAYAANASQGMDVVKGWLGGRVG